MTEAKLPFFLTPSAVQKLKRCGRSTVIRAIESGDLQHVVVKNQNGREFYGIKPIDAKAWTPRKKIGRPKDSEKCG